MSQHKIEPHKITKPIQLLAAWLTGLAIIDISFLTAASQITTPSWTPGLLVVAAVINVPLFVVSIFLLQTKFRPEMQEDSYYSDYLNRKNDQQSFVYTQFPDNEIETKRISILAESKPENFNEQVKELISDEKIDELTDIAGNSRSLSELYLKPERWFDVVEKWKDDRAFKEDLDEAIKHKLIVLENNNQFNAKLTELGRKAAEKAESKVMLFAQKNSSYFEHGGI
jgi:hypothetical protein